MSIPCDIVGDRVLAAVYQNNAAQNCSDRYQLFPTYNVIEVFRNMGYDVTRMQGLSRRSKAPEYGKHLLTFRREEDMDDKGAQEFVFINSHNGSCAAQLMHGYFRFACSNGCIFGEFSDRVGIRHTNPLETLMESIHVGIQLQKEKAYTIHQMRNTYLSQAGKDDFVSASALLRGVHDPRQLLWVNRHEDMDSDLWTLYNRVQEALMRGKYDTYNAEKRQFRKARAITGVSETLRINTNLWKIANNFLVQEG